MAERLLEAKVAEKFKNLQEPSLQMESAMRPLDDPCDLRGNLAGEDQHRSSCSGVAGNGNRLV